MSDSTIGVGMLGYGFMARAHSGALRTLEHLPGDRPVSAILVSIAGRDAVRLAAAASQYGFREHTSDWRSLIDDPEVQLFDNTGPNNVHAEPTIAAALAGKHVICEKPLARDAEEAHRLWRSVEQTGVKHMCAFNYRFVPAIRMARDLIAAGELGEIRHFRAAYLQDWLSDPGVAALWRLDRSEAGSGALGDLGSHVFDLARFLVGEPQTVSGSLQTFTKLRGGREVDVDDAFAAAVTFTAGALGTIEASRCAPGRKNGLRLEVNGSQGSIAFDLERLNELQISEGSGGFRTVLVTGDDYPMSELWWPSGHTIGWEHSFIHEFDHLLRAIRDDSAVAPLGATFEDGYRAAEVCDAVARSAMTGERIEIRYADAGGTAEA